MSDVTITVVTTNSDGKHTRDRLPSDMLCEDLISPGKIHYYRKQFGVSFSIPLIFSLWRHIVNSDVVVLHGVYSSPTFPTLLACRVLSKPLVWFPHGSLTLWHNRSRTHLKKVWELLCSALIIPEYSLIRVTSNAEIEGCRMRMPHVRTFISPIGVDVPEVLPPRKWLPNGVLRILYIGRLDPIKAIDNLIRAVAILGPMVELVLVGDGDVEYRKVLFDEVAKLEISDRVRFLGNRYGDEKSEAFRTADVCVLPSHTENFGIVIPEALAHGVPVIASRKTPWQEVETVDCGYWVDNSPESLAEALMKISIRDLAEMGSNGRTWVTETFEWQSIAQQFQRRVSDLILEVSQNRKQGRT
jgi:glycosyltransferase involved in cell wall biosynthesis